MKSSCCEIVICCFLCVRKGVVLRPVVVRM
jgi:hypothetical protein